MTRPHVLHLDYYGRGLAACGAADDPLYVVVGGDANATTCPKCREWLVDGEPRRQIPAKKTVPAGMLIKFPGPAERRRRKAP